ncbi:hypothetical protein K3495_g9917 [Podosphaera aphanis]|nr:hypothetical protein K3495_g9917 [Podosphaera aphanis]
MENDAFINDAFVDDDFIDAAFMKDMTTPILLPSLTPETTKPPWFWEEVNPHSGQITWPRAKEGEEERLLQQARKSSSEKRIRQRGNFMSRESVYSMMFSDEVWVNGGPNAPSYATVLVSGDSHAVQMDRYHADCTAQKQDRLPGWMFHGAIYDSRRLLVHSGRIIGGPSTPEDMISISFHKLRPT